MSCKEKILGESSGALSVNDKSHLSNNVSTKDYDNDVNKAADIKNLTNTIMNIKQDTERKYSIGSIKSSSFSSSTTEADAHDSGDHRNINDDDDDDDDVSYVDSRSDENDSSSDFDIEREKFYHSIKSNKKRTYSSSKRVNSAQSGATYSANSHHAPCIENEGHFYPLINKPKNHSTDSSFASSVMFDGAIENDMNSKSKKKKKIISEVPWSLEEDLVLLEKQRIIGNDWAGIASFLPERSRIDVKVRFISITRAGNKLWSKDDDEKLLRLYREHKGYWVKVASFFPSRTKNGLKTRFKELKSSPSNPLPIPSYGSPLQVFYYRNHPHFLKAQAIQDNARGDLKWTKNQSKKSETVTNSSGEDHDDDGDGNNSNSSSGSYSDSNNKKKRRGIKKVNECNPITASIPSGIPPNSNDATNQNEKTKSLIPHMMQQCHHHQHDKIGRSLLNNQPNMKYTSYGGDTLSTSKPATQQYGKLPQYSTGSFDEMLPIQTSSNTMIFQNHPHHHLSSPSSSSPKTTSMQLPSYFPITATSLPALQPISSINHFALNSNHFFNFSNSAVKMPPYSQFYTTVHPRFISIQQSHPVQYSGAEDKCRIPQKQKYA